MEDREMKRRVEKEEKMEKMEREKKERERKEEQDRRWRRRNVVWRGVKGENRKKRRVLIKMYIEGAGKRNRGERGSGDKAREWQVVGDCGDGGREGEKGAAGNGKRNIEMEDCYGRRRDAGGKEDKMENDGESKG